MGGVGTYLGTTDPRNLPFYRRMGFAVAGTAPPGPDGPVVTGLHRGHDSGSSANHMMVSP